MEYLSTSGMIPSVRFESFFLYLVNPLKMEMICLIFIIYYIFKQIRLLFELRYKYLKEIWSWIECGMIISSWIVLNITLWRYQEFQRFASLFSQTNGYIYINFQLLSYINDLLIYLYGFCCFFGTIKFLYLCRYSQRLSLFTQTLQHAKKELFSFSMMFSLVFISFICLFYLLFNSTISTCSSIWLTMRMLFKMTLLKFDTVKLIQAQSILGPLCFSLFIFLIVFVCLSMFVSIISDSYRYSRDHLNKDEEIFSFMFDKFQ